MIERKADKFGNVFKYYPNEDVWIKEGILQAPQTVEEDVDGLVYPQLYDQITQIENSIKEGLNFQKFKIFAGPNNPYFYYLNSGDGLIEFRQKLNTHGQPLLNVEFNRQSFFRKLRIAPCLGPCGLQGLEGDQGNDGIPAPNEI